MANHRQQTQAKAARERTVRERRERKEEKKRAAAAERKERAQGIVPSEQEELVSSDLVQEEVVPQDVPSSRKSVAGLAAGNRPVRARKSSRPSGCAHARPLDRHALDLRGGDRRARVGVDVGHTRANPAPAVEADDVDDLAFLR